MKKRLIGLILAIGAGAAVAKLMTAKKAEWQGLSEDQVRAKVEQRMPTRVPEEKRAEVADKVVTKMRDRGMLAEEELSEEPVPAEVTSDEGEPDAETEGDEETPAT